MNLKKSPLYHFIRRQKRKIWDIFEQNPTSISNSLKIRGDDVFLVSYPRSGNTWMRFVLGQLVYNIEVNFDNMEVYFPDIYRNTHSQLECLKNPRYLKSHEPYDKRYPKVIYLVRDPRDVVVSYYYWLLKFKRYDGNFDGFIDIFFDPKSLPYGRWDVHCEGWRKNHHKVSLGFLMLKYEDLLDKPLENIQKILNFINMDIDDATIHHVIEKK